MKVLIVEPGRTPYEKEIDNESKMAAVVGGPIEAIYPFQETVAVVCNSEGRNMQLPFNRSVPNGYGNIYGTFFICGLGDNGMGFCSLKPEQFNHYTNYFSQADTMVRMKETRPLSFVISPLDLRTATLQPKRKKRRTKHYER